MAGKAIHLPDDVHASIKSLAEVRGITMGELLKQLIREGADKVVNIPIKPRPTVRKITVRRPKEKPEPVKKKPLSVVKVYDKEAAAAVNQPPFWQGSES